MGIWEWLKHVIRMKQEGRLRNLFESKREGRRKVRRPRLRWMEVWRAANEERKEKTRQ
jgi:hypothetical protein